MKKYIKIVCSLFLCYSSPAAIITVCNIPGSGAQYNNLQTAVNAAASGDIIYVQGSPTSYGDISISNKALKLIGAGYAPDKQSVQPSTLNSLTLNGAITGSLNGSEIQGFVINGGFSINNSAGGMTVINGISIVNNKLYALSFNGAANKDFTNIKIQNNYIRQALTGTNSSIFSNFLVQNNVFYFTSYGVSGFYNTSAFLFDHNLMYNGDHVFSGSRYISATNNIFVERTNASPGTWGEYTSFSNNITYNCGQNSPWLIDNNIDGGNNISNQNPQMVDQAAIDAGTDNPLLNFSVPSGPANNSGSDGLDMGVRYDATGELNWGRGRTSLLPYIYSSALTNTTVPAGGTLEIQVTAKSNY